MYDDQGTVDRNLQNQVDPLLANPSLNEARTAEIYVLSSGWSAEVGCGWRATEEGSGGAPTNSRCKGESLTTLWGIGGVNTAPRSA